MGIGYNPRIVTNGLVLCLDAANIKSYPGSGTTWTDLSGAGNHGTLINGPTYNSANKGGIVFDGSNDRIDVPTLPYQFLSTGFTVSVVFKYSQTTTNDNLIAWGSSAFNSGMSYSWEIRIRGNSNVEFSPGIYATGGSSPTRLNYTQSPALNGRIAVMDVSYEANGNSIIYENGAAKSSLNYSGVGTYTNTQSLRIGRGTDSNFPGTIYSVKIYNRSLTSAEIQQNFNALRGRYGI